MALLKFGDRGTQVVQIQQALNGKPSKLSRLIPDGAFGAKTQARVIEFQRDNGLKADGIVGDATRAKLEGGEPFTRAEAAAILNEIANVLGTRSKTGFLVATQPLLNDPQLVGFALAPAAAAAVIIFLLLVFAVLMINSQNRENQRAGRELAEKVEQLRQELNLTPPAELISKALAAGRDAARKLAERARTARDNCLQNNPQASSIECARAIAALSTTLLSLLEKAGKPVGGGITAENLLKGLALSGAAVIAAARAAADACGCSGLIL